MTCCRKCPLFSFSSTLLVCFFPRSVLLRDRTSMEQRVRLNTLPDDILEEILVRIETKELCLTCRRVCKALRNVLDRKSFWKWKCERDGSSFPDIQGDDVELDYRRISLQRPYDRNFIKNWNAEQKLNGWKILSNGGDRFAVENERCHYAASVLSIGITGLHKCWVTSFGTCKKQQQIALVKEGVQEDVLDRVKPTILVSDFTTPRKDCASVYKIRVDLLDAQGKSLDAYENTRAEPQWNGADWMQVIHKFENYPPGVRSVRFVHEGKDSQFWAGHYGPKLTGSVVRVLADSSQALPWDVDTHGMVPVIPDD